MPEFHYELTEAGRREGVEPLSADEQRRDRCAVYDCERLALAHDTVRDLVLCGRHISLTVGHDAVEVVRSSERSAME